MNEPGTSAVALSCVADSTVSVKPPYWVKIERAGGSFTGYHSADGKTWSTVGTTLIEMADPVLIGIAVTSHAAGEDRTFVALDEIATTAEQAAIRELQLAPQLVGAILDRRTR